MSLGFVFPGQGSQSVGMLKELSGQFSEVEQTFTEASEVLGYDLWDIVQNGPADKLNRTEVTQPAMLAAGIAVWRVWQAAGGAQPVMLAGHSLGEYTALVVAGSLAFPDAVGLVAERGRLMQAAVPAGSGAMAAILGMEDEAVVQACADAAQHGVVEAVNFNSPGQVVIAGDKDAVERVVSLARERGAKRAVVLPVSVPSHCALMQPAAERLATVLESIPVQAPAIPVLNNVDVFAAGDPADIRRALVRQLYRPVRWVEIIHKMQAEGVDRLIECGPGKVLVGLNRRIDRKMTALPVYDPATLTAALEG